MRLAFPVFSNREAGCQSLSTKVLLAKPVRRKQDEQFKQLEASITPARTGREEGSPRKNLVSPKPQLSVVHINMDVDQILLWVLILLISHLVGEIAFPGLLF